MRRTGTKTMMMKTYGGMAMEDIQKTMNWCDYDYDYDDGSYYWDDDAGWREESPRRTEIFWEQTRLWMPRTRMRRRS